MRVDNRHKTKIQLRWLTLLLAVFLLLTVALSFYIFIISKDSKIGWATLLISFLITIHLIKKLFTTKYFDYEHSGEVISIKYFHPLKTGLIKPSIEMPKYYLKSFKITKKWKSFYLQLFIKGSNDKTININFNVTNLSNHQIINIQKSLQNNK